MRDSSAEIDRRLARAEAVLEHRFSDRELLLHALTHPSALSDGAPTDYERLEFLGDSIVGFVVAEEVFRRFPDLREGGMTRIKVSTVNGAVLATVAERLGLEDLIILGESELGTGRRGMASALENAFEALTAALYLDAGLPTARTWVLKTLGEFIDESVAASPENPKSELQETVQSVGGVVTYEIIAQEGPPHDRVFVARALINGCAAGEGSGRSKKEAEVAAAASALEDLPRDPS